MLNTELRPLGAGELLDRAVTLYVRRFVPIVAVLAVAMLPIVAFNALVSPNEGRTFADMARVFAAGSDRAASKAALDALSHDGAGGAQAFTVFFFSVAVRLLEWSAVVAVIAAAYAGTTTTFVEAYHLAARRWATQLVVGVIFAGIAIVVAIPILIAYVIVIVAVAVLAIAKATVAGIVAGIAGGLVIIALVAVTFGWLMMAYQLATVAVVTESMNPPNAIGAGLRRAFGKETRWRTLVAGLVVGALSFGGTLPIVAVAASASALSHLPLLYFALLGAGNVLLEGLIAAFAVVFATDVRVRREGLDLIALAR